MCLVISTEDTRLISATEDSWAKLRGPIKGTRRRRWRVGSGQAAVGEGLLGKQRGVGLCPRAPEQRARIVERRGALLGYTMHGVGAHFKQGCARMQCYVRLGEAAFAGHAP